MFFKIKYHLKFLILFFLLSCQLQEPYKTHGIVFLENRAKKLDLNKTNKNDVIKIMGEPQIKNENDENSWIYLERILKKGKYYKLGKHTLEENNILVLNFDKYGILKFKQVLTKEDLKKINFSKKTTNNDFSKKSFVYSFLQSLKQKMYSNRKREF